MYDVAITVFLNLSSARVSVCFPYIQTALLKIDVQLVSRSSVASWIMNAKNLTVWCTRYLVLIDGI
jgi:hypothetical protein